MTKSLRIWLYMALLSSVIMVVLLTSGRKQSTFVPPDFDPRAQMGTPAVTENLPYVSAQLAEYEIGITAAVPLQDEKAYIFFANFLSNDVWMKVRICDSTGNILGESGLVKPDQYIEYVSFQADTYEKEVVVKVMCYEPHTYHSKGSAQISLPIIKIS